MRFNKLADNLNERVNRILYDTKRGKKPKCPVCKDGSMIRHTQRGAMCDACGTRLW